MIKNNLRANFVSLFTLLLFCFSISCDRVANYEKHDKTIQLENGNFITEADDSNLSNEDQENIQFISEKLAVRYVFKQDPDQEEIPENLVDFFYNGFVHMYNSGLDEVEEIRKNYVLVAKSPAHPREVLVWTNQSESWLDNWRAGNTKTGVPEIDELINRFDMTLETFREYSVTKPDAMAKLHSNRPINVYAVGNLFAELQEIEKAGPDGLLTGGRDVKADIMEEFILIDITVGSGDCPSGCINKINYKFRVFSDGSVELAE